MMFKRISIKFKNKLLALKSSKWTFLFYLYLNIFKTMLYFL
jgi:hypothetical protein